MKKILRIRLRTLLILFAAVAVATAWLANTWHGHRREQQLIFQMQSNFEVALVDHTEVTGTIPIFL